ncbi:MAG: hypothetical protein IIA67_10865 [Planctomycetes bacterium]|nr:hypothetical protein [Planctomycetota bacterium]
MTLLCAALMASMTFALVALPGCGGSPTTVKSAVAKNSSAVPVDETTGNRSKTRSQRPSKQAEPRLDEQPLAPNLGGLLEEARKNPQPTEPKVRPYKRFHPRTVNKEVIRRIGLRKLQGKHLTLYTDLPAAADIDELPQVFDLAFPQWCKYFHVDPKQAADWRMTGFLMKDKALFVNNGLLPPALPKFPNGYAIENRLWMYQQKNSYYRRHLLLHEGTHGFMYSMLGGCGGPWYMEGTAEFLGTHRWDGKQLTLGYFPKNREEVKGWGRIKLVARGLETGRTMFIGDLLRYDNHIHRDDAYGWCWAAVAFMDAHPKYQERFRQLYHYADVDGFNARFRDLFRDDWQELIEEFILFTTSLQYGHDVQRTVIDFKDGKPLTRDGAQVMVAADRGWQSSGVRLEAGKTYQITATGRFQVADGPKPWISEAQGVSIRYHKSRPLGVLLGAVRPEKFTTGDIIALTRPFAVARRATITPKKTGTLYLKINDSAGELGDNAGELSVTVVPK